MGTLPGFLSQRCPLKIAWGVPGGIDQWLMSTANDVEATAELAAEPLVSGEGEDVLRALQQEAEAQRDERY